MRAEPSSGPVTATAGLEIGEAEEVQRVVLRLAVDIPRLVEVTPRLTHWRTGQPMAKRVVRFRAGSDEAVVIRGVRSDDDRLVVSYREVEPGRVYEIALTPRDTSEPWDATVMIHAEAPRVRTGVRTDDSGSGVKPDEVVDSERNQVPASGESTQVGAPLRRQFTIYARVIGEPVMPAAATSGLGGRNEVTATEGKAGAQ